MGTTRQNTLTTDLWKFVGILGIFSAAILGVLLLTQTSAGAAFTGLPTQTPRRDLPIALDGAVLDQAQVGDFIVVGGSFTQVETRDGQVHDTSGVYAYHINTGELVEEFLPTFTRGNGAPSQINAVESAGSGQVFLGGQFTNADGVFRNRLVKFTIETGQLDNSFVPNFNAEVTEATLDSGRLFVGGEFTQVNGATRLRLAEVNPNTGAVTGFRFDITENTRAPSIQFGPRHLGVTPDGVLVVAHRGERVAGQYRPGLALINLNSNTLLGYSTNFWDGGPIFTLDADVSPDGSFVVLVSNGGDFPLEGSDVGLRFDITNRNAPNQSYRWIARNFDSTYSVAISDNAVFMGGHFCTVEGPNAAQPFPGIGEYTNDNSCFGATPAIRFPGTVSRDQIAAFDPLTGTALDWDPGSDASEAVFSLEVIDRGLLIGHDGSFLGRDGNQRRAWNVGRHGFLDNLYPDGNAAATGHFCQGHRATIVGTNADDVINGTSGFDVIVGLGGRDIINGLGGVDIICAGEGNDVVDGGAGNDIIDGNEGRDLLRGGNGNDTINGNRGADTIHGDAGNDIISGGLWHDVIFGGTGDDVLRGNAANDRILGNGGDDKIYGASGVDFLAGGFGDDLIQGGQANDQLQGGSGTDDVNGGIDNDRCVGGVFGGADAPWDSLWNCETR